MKILWSVCFSYERQRVQARMREDKHWLRPEQEYMLEVMGELIEESQMSQARLPVNVRVSQPNHIKPNHPTKAVTAAAPSEAKQAKKKRKPGKCTLCEMVGH